LLVRGNVYASRWGPREEFQRAKLETKVAIGDP
jgi:hypothetical protein